MWQGWGKTTLAILGGIGTVIGVATVWGVYPLGVIVLLAVALVAALWNGAMEHRRANAAAVIAQAPIAPDPRARKHDAGIVLEIRHTLPRRSVTWLRQHDFAASWHDEWMDGVREVERLEDVEHIAFDPELQRSLTALFDSVTMFTQLLARHGNVVPSDTYEMLMNVGWSPAEADGLVGDDRVEYERRTSELNHAADVVAEAYDDFIDVARERLLLDMFGEDATDTTN
jgi:hypothetical protein